MIGKLHTSGARFVALSRDRSLMRQMKREEFIGREVEVSVSRGGEGAFRLIAARAKL